ncbi:NTP transferase domain-containing protein [Lysinimonas soli]|uniref:NTP transferase domain-containing protein n=1 Tax=Lysinimonas soli TaxID=1074233 RepID=A0ABW0NRW8_9MICO
MTDGAPGPLPGLVPGLVGVVLAAGAGVRAGGPKGLRRLPDGTPWVAHAVSVLQSAGCSTVLVVVGSAAADVAALAPASATVVHAPDASHGLSESLRTALGAAARLPAPEAVLLTLVDLPGMPGAVAARVVAAAPVDAATLRRAVVNGRPTHPVLIGRAHWDAVAASADGDRGAGPYLREHGAAEVECAELWDGADVDS